MNSRTVLIARGRRVILPGTSTHSSCTSFLPESAEPDVPHREAAAVRHSDRTDRNWKTHLMTALGYTACERGITVRFTRVIDMINRLTTAQINGTLELALKSYLKPSLLLLDELYLIDRRGADLLFQVAAARYESGSIVITTNRPFRDWGRIFDIDNTLATAMIDRLMHHGEAMVIQGNSFRTKGDNPDE